MLQAGLNIMPSGEHSQKYSTESDRATICLQELTKWLACFADTFIQHKHTDSTQKARQRSGTQCCQSGLTPEQSDQRARRGRAKATLRTAQNIQAEVKAYDTPDRRLNPRSWSQLKLWEKNTLQDLRNGSLHESSRPPKMPMVVGSKQNHFE